MFRKRKGQGTMEYLVLTTIILGVFLTMSNYFKRGVQGRWKSAIDDIGEQYDPRVTDSLITQDLRLNSTTIVTSVPGSLYGQNGIWTMRSDESNSLETKTGGTVVSPF